MTAKDYRLLAALVRKHLDATWETQPVAAMAVEAFGVDLATELGKDNPAFNPAIFFKACNIEVPA
jgi:hypothetical protein